MKGTRRMLLLGFSLLIYNINFSQDDNWYKFKLDETVSVSMPGKNVNKIDTIVDGLKINQFYIRFQNTTFITQKSEIENKLIEDNLSKLPYDKKSLVHYYKGFAIGMKKGTNANRLTEIEIKNEELIGEEPHF